MPVPERNPLRLTLRTLLAYLDDTLEPAQVKAIGEKVAESDTAQELIARIKQVTRRRRLTTPPAGTRLDPNVIAEYMDSRLSEDQVAEVEQTCLGSDVHLAEVAACHQILTLVLGEPMLIPPQSRQRMYGLVKGRESIPFRRPPYVESSDEEPLGDLVPDEDVIRPLGLPIVRPGGDWRTHLTLIGSGLAACILLVVSVGLAVRVPTEGPREGMGLQVAQNGRDKGAGETTQPETKKTEAKVSEPEPKKTESEPKKTETEPKKTEPEARKTEPEPRKPEPMPVMPPEQRIPILPASVVRKVVGRYDPGKAGPSVLLQFHPEKKQWQRLDLRDADVQTGSSLVSLPGFRSVVRLKKGLQLELWGNLREVGYFPPVQESMAELHDHDLFDLDLTLQRGRITVTNFRPAPSRIRLRFDNPTNPDLKNVWDLTLETPDTEILLDQWSAFKTGEPFYRTPDDPNRIGPQAQLHLIVLKGRITVQRDNNVFNLQEPPGTSIQIWSSFTETRGTELPAIPDWALPNPKLPGNLAEEVRKRYEDTRDRMLAARDSLATALSGKNIEVSLPLVLRSENPLERTLAVRSFGALNDLGSLIDALADPDRRDVRQSAADTLRRWIACERDNDYKLYAELQKVYTQPEADILMGLLHTFSTKQITEKATYEILVVYLDSSKLAIRELAAWHLYALAPIGANIRYAPEAEPGVRRLAQAAWQKLIDEGKVPQQQR